MMENRKICPRPRLSNRRRNLHNPLYTDFIWNQLRVHSPHIHIHSLYAVYSAIQFPFLPRDATLARYMLSLSVCLSVPPSQAGIAYKRPDELSCFWAWRLPSTCPIFSVASTKRLIHKICCYLCNINTALYRAAVFCRGSRFPSSRMFMWCFLMGTEIDNKQQGSPKIIVLSSVTLSQTPDLENIATTTRSRCQQNPSSSTSTVELVDDTYTTIDESWLFTSRSTVTIKLHYCDLLWICCTTCFYSWQDADWHSA